MPSGITVAGINATLGINLDSFIAGIDKAEHDIQAFHKNLARISLNGIVKGDPFSTTRKHIQESKRNLDLLYNSWATHIDSVGVKLSKLAAASKRSTDNISKSWNKMINSWKKSTAFDVDPEGKILAGPAGKFKKELGQLQVLDKYKDLGAGEKRTKYKLSDLIYGPNLDEFRKYLTRLKTILPEAEKEINRFLKLRKTLMITPNKLVKELETLEGSVVPRLEKKYAEDYATREKELKRGYIKQGALGFGGELSEARDRNKILADRKQRIREISVALAQARTELTAGIQVDKNKATIAQKLAQLEREGITLSRQRKLEMEALSKAEKGVTTRDYAYDPTKVKIIQKVSQEIYKLRSANRELNKEIEMGINVDKNKATLMNNIMRLSELKIRLTDRETESLKRQRKIQENIEKYGQDVGVRKWTETYGRAGGSTYQYATALGKINPADLGKEQIFPNVRTDPSFKYQMQARQERAKETIALRMEEQKLLGYIKEGYNVEKSKTELLRVYNRLKDITIGKTKENIIQEEKTLSTRKLSLEENRKEILNVQKIVEKNKELLDLKAHGIKTKQLANALEKNLIALETSKVAVSKKYLESIRKATKEVSRAAKESTGFLSKDWFVNRVRWFLQLRLFWSLYTGAGRAVRDFTEFQTQLARAMRTANSEVLNANAIATEYISVMREARAIHGVDWEKGAEVLYQLTSAGLSSEKALAGFHSVLSMIVGLEGDARELTKSVAGVYNNFANTITHVTTEEEKFRYITDLMSGAWRRHQMEIGELTDALNMSASVAKIAGLNIGDLVAILSVSHDHMIKAGRAGRSLTNVLVRLSRTPIEFQKAFRVAFDPTQPLKFMDIMKQIHENFKNQKLSVFELSEVFERMGIRGAPEFAVLAENWDKVTEAVKKYKNILGETEKIEVERLDNLGSRFARFFGILYAHLSKIRPYTKWIDNMLDFYNELMKQKLSEQEAPARIKTIIESVTGMIQRGPKKFMPGITYELAGKLDLQTIKFLREELEKLNKELERVEKTRGTAAIWDIPIGNIKNKMEPIKTIIDYWEYMQSIKGQWKEEAGAYATGGKIRPYTESDEERKYKWKYKITDTQTKLNILLDEYNKKQQEILDKEKEIAIVEKRHYEGFWEDGVKKYKDQSSNIKHLYKLTNDLSEERTQIENNLKKIVSEQDKIIKSTNAEYYERLNTEIKSKEDIVKYNDKELQAVNKRMMMEGITAEELKTIVANNEKIFYLDLERATLAYERASQHGKELEASIALGEAIDAASEKQNLADDQARKSRRDTQLKELAAVYDIKNAELERSKSIADLNNEKDKSLEIDYDMLMNQRQHLYTQKEIIEDETQLRNIDNEIYRINTRILENLEQQRRRANVLYGIYARLRDSLPTSKEFLGQIGEQTARDFGAGFSGIAFEATGGFQTQRQSVADLEKQLDDLDGELGQTQTAIDKAIEEDDIESLHQYQEQAEAIKNNMKLLKEEINRLEDPVKNLGDAFKTFFKDLIDGIRKAIIQWLVMKAITAGVGAFSGGNDYSMADWSGGPAAARGGILPHIKAFKSFSRGGMTSRPTLALLGDNRSKRELVIPEENIKPNSVSGYTRDREEKQPINIINILTKEDIAMAMSGIEGERVIVNHIGRDINRRGPIYRQMKT